VTDDPRISAAAAWILSEVESGKQTYQSRVAMHVRRSFGEDLTYKNPNGNWALDKRINEAFKRLSGDMVVWERSNQCWRLRREKDKPGRMQS
jgi:hypothetical protein